MTAGIRIRNASSIVTIDSSLENYALYSKGSVTTTQVVGTPVYGATIVVPVEAIVAFNGNAIVTVAFDNNNGNGTKTVGLSSKNSAVVNYWVFYKTANAIIDTSTNVGLRIRRPSDGVVVFDSRAKYMRVLDFQDGTMSLIGTDAKPSGTYPVIPAIVLLQRAGFSQTTAIPGQPDPPNLYIEQQQFFNMGGFGFVCEWWQTSSKTYDHVSTTPQGLVYTQQRYTFMVIDTTNL